jgi:hypothetical protein
MKRTPEHCEKIRQAHIGKNHSIETREKIRESKRADWARGVFDHLRTGQIKSASFTCENCGGSVSGRPGDIKKRRFCSYKCSQTYRIGRTRLTNSHKLRHEYSDGLRAEIESLYRSGKGAKIITKELGISNPTVVLRGLKRWGLYKPYSLKTAPGCGKSTEPTAEEKRVRTYERDMRRMRRRVEKCLNKKAKKRPGWKSFKQRYWGDPAFRAYQIARSRAKKLIKREYRVGRTVDLVGCTGEQHKRYIESKWAKGMTWENLGQGKGKWNIDHIIPCASFNLADPEQQKQCFHFSNTQPLWWKANMRKRAKIDKHRTLSLPLDFRHSPLTA